MSKESVLIILGIIVALAPFSGLPLSWLEIGLPLIGIAVAVLGYTYRPKREALHAENLTET